MNKTEKAARMSIASNLALIFIKLAAGMLSSSIGMISEAIHSSMDLATRSLVTM